VFDNADDIRSVTTACTFCVVGVNRTVLESGDCLFDEARLVERVCMDKCLDVVLVADS
jgi:hypothetical protein